MNLNSKQAKFAAEHPAVWTWINDNMDFTFAASMFAAVARYGALTPRQLDACERCLTRAAEPAAPSLDMATLETAWNAAARANNQTKATIAGIEISTAKENSRNPGAVYLKEGRTYLGKIMGGQFTPSRDCTPDHIARLSEINLSMAA